MGNARLCFVSACVCVCSFQKPKTSNLNGKVGKGGRMEKQIDLWLRARSKLLLTHVDAKPPDQQPETYYSSRFIIALVLW